MWIFTPIGFFSVVQKSGDPTLTVRARVRADLERLRDRYLPQLGPTRANESSDYEYRASVTHSDFAQAMARMAEDIDYPNFKNHVAKELSPGYSRVCGNLWHSITKLNREDKP